MPDHLEFTFMRGFVERQRTGVPHNPRLRGLPRSEQYHIPSEELTDDDPDARGSPDSLASPLKSPASSFLSTRVWIDTYVIPLTMSTCRYPPIIVIGFSYLV